MCCIQGRFQGVCLAVMTGPFVPQVGYSALKPMIKYQTLSLQVFCNGQQPTFTF